MYEPTLLDLLKNGVHFGHQTSRWHPRMEQYIFTSRDGIHIINLEKSLAHLSTAQHFVRDLTSKGGIVIFIGTKRQAKSIVRAAAEESGAYHITERWLGGLFTNFGVVSRLIQRLRTLTDDRKTGALEKYTKKERLRFDEEIEKLEKLVGGIRDLKKLPQAVFIVDIKTEKTAVREAKKAGIPIIAMVDTNTDPADITYPIPANDDATKSIALITSALASAVSEGRAKAKELAVLQAEADEKAKAEAEEKAKAVAEAAAAEAVDETAIPAALIPKEAKEETV